MLRPLVRTGGRTDSDNSNDGTNTGNDYEYDKNGNLTQDLNKGITTVSYNFLNLPQAITFADGSSISYLYRADGEKLRTVFSSGGSSHSADYCQGVIYENGTQKWLLTQGTGYLTLSDGKYHYYLQDHLANNRRVVSQTGQVEETNHYYPFGGTFAATGNVQPYKYNGKEPDTRKALNLYDYGARWYDPALGRFTTIDPLAEKAFHMSPYAYCGNNPIVRIDPTGMLGGDYYDSYGIYLGNDGIDDNKVFQLKDKYRAKFENTEVNWGGTLKEKHYAELQAKSNDLGTVQNAFVTGDVVSDKRIQSLHPAIRMKATDFIKEANASLNGTFIRVTQGFRTYAEQDALYTQGRTTQGNIVTKAKGGFSTHNFGLAFDIAGITNGKLYYNLDWNFLSTLGKSKGFEWGGDWRFKDKPHFQNMFGKSLKELRALPKDKKGLPILKP